jgi:PDZ domain-containing secreted protein
VWARYELPRATYDEVVGRYGATFHVLGATVAPFFPLLESTFHASTDVIVLSVEDPPAKKRLMPGEVVRAVDGEPVDTIDGFARRAQDAWDQADPGDSVVLEVETNGAPRSVNLPKPKRN